MTPDLATRAATLLAGQVSRRAKAPGPVPGGLGRAVQHELARAHRRARLMKAGSIALAASLALAAVGGAVVLANAKHAPAAVLAVSGVAVLEPAGGEAVDLEPGMAVGAGARITTHQGGTASLELDTGTRLALPPSSELDVTSVSRRKEFHLATGTLGATVRPLEADERFIITTDDVEVEVHGTRFEVESTQVDAACDVATASRVRVFEGRVQVRRGADAFLLVGPAHWPECTGGDPSAVDEPAAPAAPTAAVQKPPLAVRERASARAGLDELNRRYRAAIAARRRGDLKGALQLFHDFYSAWPDSQLAEAAAVEELRLLAKLDAAQASAAARHYLEKYPQGFARDEAKAMLPP